MIPDNYGKSKHFFANFFTIFKIKLIFFAAADIMDARMVLKCILTLEDGRKMYDRLL